MRPSIVSAAVLALMWFVLPVRLPKPAAGPANARCQTIADAGDAVRDEQGGVLERCSTLNPTDVELLSDLGAWYEKHGRAADAEGAYRRALSIDRDAADLRARLARLLIARGDSEGARREADAALKAQPNRRALVDIVDRANRPGSTAPTSVASLPGE